jgi:thiol-disulfide isomerase/thioredoxin
LCLFLKSKSTVRLIYGNITKNTGRNEKMRFQLRISASAMVLLVLSIVFTSVTTNGHTLYQDGGFNRVLVEEFTGTNCSWCPDGSLLLEQLDKKYGDSVIMVSVHIDDSMEVERLWIDDGFQRLFRFMPSASINRKYYEQLQSSSIAIAKQYWSEKISEELSQTASCDIAIDSVTSVANDESKIDVWIRFTPLHSNMMNVRLNIYVVEDSVSGKGYGYDQSNEFSSKKGYEDHPYYYKGNPIVGYKHRYVLRHAVGDAFGIERSLPDTALAGLTYQRRFTINLLPRWSVPRTKIIAFAQMYDTVLEQRKIIGSNQVSLPIKGLLSTCNEHNTALEQKNDIVVISDGYVQISPALIGSFTHVRIYSLSGQMIREWTPNPNDSNIWNIHQYGLSNGFYIITLSGVQNIKAFQCIYLN